MPYPIEVACFGSDSYAVLQSVARELNESQGEFIFTMVPADLRWALLARQQKSYRSVEVWEWLADYRRQAKGHRPFIIALVDGELSGPTLGKIFGTRKPGEGDAVFTTEEKRFAPTLESYCAYNLAKYAIGFVAPVGLTHAEPRDCYFSRKMYKPDLMLALQSGNICVACREKLRNDFTPEIARAAAAMTSVVTRLGSSVDAPLAAKSTAFISYAHRDNLEPGYWLDRLTEMLAPLDAHLSVWSDKQLETGDAWREGIQQALENATVAVLLLSPPFLASKFVNESEIPVLLERTGVRIIPVLLRECLWEAKTFKYPDPKTGPKVLELGSLQFCKTADKLTAIAAMEHRDQDGALKRVALDVHRFLGSRG